MLPGRGSMAAVLQRINVSAQRYRTFAHSALACGSMVLYRYCVSFFRPAGRKNAGALWATKN
jgi:hypothetical protein